MKAIKLKGLTHYYDAVARLTTINAYMDNPNYFTEKFILKEELLELSKMLEKFEKSNNYFRQYEK